MSLRKRFLLLCFACISAPFHLILASTGSHLSSSESQVEKTGKYSRCGSVLHLLDCHPLEQVTFFRNEVNEIRSIYEPGYKCDIKNVYFHWFLSFENETVNNLLEFDNGDTFAIEPHTLGFGNYRIVLNVAEYGGHGIEDVLSDECVFTIIERPRAIIAGGEEIAMSNDFFDLNQNGSLIHEWNGDVEKKSCSDFPNMSTGNDVLLGGSEDYVLGELTHDLKLSVVPTESDWQSTSQIIRVKRSRTEINITCLENCTPGNVDVMRKITLGVRCIAGCSGIDLSKFTWSTNGSVFSGVTTKELSIKPNVLHLGTSYKIYVTYEGDESISAKTDLITHYRPRMDSCEIKPMEGIALKTKFFVKCIPDYDEDNIYELYSLNTELLLTSGPHLEDLPIILGASDTIEVKLIDKHHVFKSKELTVTVKSTFRDVTNKDELKNEVQKQFFDENSKQSLINLIGSKEHDQLMQTFMVLVGNLVELPKEQGFEDAIKDYDIKILDMMRNVTLNTGKRARQFGSIIKKMSRRYDNESDPDFAKLASDICEKASDEYLKYIQRDSYPQYMLDEVVETTKAFSECFRSSSAPNWGILEMHETVNMTITPFPLLDWPMITENYPDYGDDQNTSKVLSKYEIAGNKTVSLCYLNAKSLTLSMIVKNKTESVGTEFFKITATKIFGQDIADTIITSHDVKVLVSGDFLRYINEEVSILLCTSRRNPFWWMRKENITTSVAMLTFVVRNEVVHNFEKPYSISFENIEKNFSWIPFHQASTPRRPNNTRINGGDFEKMQIFRIDVLGQQAYVVEFLDLAANDFLDIYVSDFVKPTSDEFKKKSTQIDEKNTLISIPHERDFNSWHYLCILPNEKMGDKMVAVKFRVYAMSCFSWKSESRTWEFSCAGAVTSTLALFDCICYHSSVLAGRITDNHVREEGPAIFVEHDLELQTNLIIFICVAVAFFLYSLLLVIISLSSDWDYGRRIYLLSDTTGSPLYEYLLIIRTGYGLTAGTTSNVVIKLYGKEAATEEHVLNSPDPDKRILQKNQEDWFFLATENYLGEILKLDIWFDCAGLKPSWYCSKIEVIDLQKNKYWYFNIKYRFEIGTKEEHFHTAVPEVLDDRKNKRKCSLKKLSLEGTHLWNLFGQEEVTFSKFKRLTIMLSIFMTTYTFHLFLYGSPKLENSDSLGSYLEYGFHAQLIWATSFGLVGTFLLHVPIVHYFRFPNHGRSHGNGYFHSDIVCWCFLILLVLVSMTVLPVLGFWVPHVTVLLWLTSAMASLLIYIILLENVIRLAYNITMERTRRIRRIFSRIKSVLAYIEAQKDFVEKKYGIDSFRPYYEHLYRPLSRSKIKERKYWAHIRGELLEIIQDVIMITVYVVLLYTVILKDRDSMTRISYQEVIDLLSGIHSRTMYPGQNISSREALENYMKHTLIFSMQSLQWYGRFLSKDPGMTIDNNNKYIGIARLRQHRSNNYSCVVYDLMRRLTENCVLPFVEGPEFGDFSEGWGHNAESDKFARMDSVWKYKKHQISGTSNYMGDFAEYPGGGYVATLGRTWKNSLINIKYLYRNNWIDRYTRSLFIEFLMYSPNSNLFQSVRVAFELGTTGYIIAKYNVQTARLLILENESNIMLEVVLAFFVLMVCVLLAKFLLRVAKKRKLVLKDLWTLTDIIIISLSVACLFLFVERSFMVKIFLDEIENAKHNEFINYFHLFSSETTLTILAAALVFIATLRLWKLLRFLLIIRIVEKTLRLSVSRLFFIFIQQTLFIFLFQLMGGILFVDQNKFRNTRDSIMTLILLALCFHKTYDFRSVRTHLHRLYYSFYMIVSLFFLTSYVAVITSCYEEAQLFHSNRTGYNVFDYLREQYQYYKEVLMIKKRRLRRRGGQDGTTSEEKGIVFPKSNEHRYAKCLKISKSKLDTMWYITLAILRNMESKSQLMKEDENFMRMFIAFMVRNKSQEENYFFVKSSEYRKTVLVDDLVLKRIELFVRYLLTRKDESEEKMYTELLGSKSKTFGKIDRDLLKVSNLLLRVNYMINKYISL
ncbi:hypothetical protein JTB14_035891 [Gonioctena quinquepunctata]|nr:hypothetical protein JTB14_035891 [Gonioctena quinquepunctata]